jgi:hypothetical protein
VCNVEDLHIKLPIAMVSFQHVQNEIPMSDEPSLGWMNVVIKGAAKPAVQKHTNKLDISVFEPQRAGGSNIQDSVGKVLLGQKNH